MVDAGVLLTFPLSNSMLIVGSTYEIDLFAHSGTHDPPTEFAAPVTSYDVTCDSLGLHDLEYAQHCATVAYNNAAQMSGSVVDPFLPHGCLLNPQGEFVFNTATDDSSSPEYTRVCDMLWSSDVGASDTAWWTLAGWDIELQYRRDVFDWGSDDGAPYYGCRFEPPFIGTQCNLVPDQGKLTCTYSTPSSVASSANTGEFVRIGDCPLRVRNDAPSTAYDAVYGHYTLVNQATMWHKRNQRMWVMGSGNTIGYSATVKTMGI